jgi:hypothetical protein
LLKLVIGAYYNPITIYQLPGFLPPIAFCPCDHSRGIVGKVFFGGKDVTGMAYPEGFR